MTMHFTFDEPYALFFLLLLPCFVWCKTHTKSFYFSKLSWLVRQNSLLSWEPWLKMFIFALMVFALAEPFVYDKSSNKHKKGRDLILAIDASGSMSQSGFDPDNRMQTKYSSMLALSQNFTKSRHDDNMGIVVFGTFAYTASPLTYDLESLSYLLRMTNVGIAGESTAIGDAIIQSLRTLSFGEAKNKAIVLLTDGYHNAGRTSPKKAVQRAKALGVKVYTIGIGKKSDFDVALLKTIAEKTTAKSYAAADASKLSKIYEDINALEPSPLRSKNYLKQELLMFIPLSLAFFLLLSWVIVMAKEEK